jgi:hypothetical protein
MWGPDQRLNHEEAHQRLYIDVEDMRLREFDKRMQREISRVREHIDREL